MTDHQADSQNARYAEAMAAARDAADQAGISLEEWLSRTILQNAADSGLVQAGEADGQSEADRYQAVAQHLEKAQAAADAAGIPVAEWLTQAILENTGQALGNPAAPQAPAPQAPLEQQPAPHAHQPAPEADLQAQAAAQPTQAPLAPPPQQPQPAAAPQQPGDQTGGDFYVPPKLDDDLTHYAQEPGLAAPAAHSQAPSDSAVQPSPEPVSRPIEPAPQFEAAPQAEPGLAPPPDVQVAPEPPLEPAVQPAAPVAYEPAEPEIVQEFEPAGSVAPEPAPEAPFDAVQQPAAPEMPEAVPEAPVESVPPPVTPIAPETAPQFAQEFEPAASVPESPVEAPPAPVAPEMAPEPAAPEVAPHSAAPDFTDQAIATEAAAPAAAVDPTVQPPQPAETFDPATAPAEEPPAQPVADGAELAQPDASPHMSETAPIDPGLTDQVDLGDVMAQPAAQPTPETVATNGGAQPAATIGTAADQANGTPSVETEEAGAEPVTDQAQTREEPQNRLAQIIASTREEMAKRHEDESAEKPATSKNALVVLPQKGGKKSGKRGHSAWLTGTLLVLLALMAAAIWIIPNLREMGLLSKNSDSAVAATKVAGVPASEKSGKTADRQTLQRMQKSARQNGAIGETKPSADAAKPKSGDRKTAMAAPGTVAKVGADRMPTPAHKHVSWYKAAAESGNMRAQVKLAELYLRGDGVAQDYKKAAQLFRKAAQEGRDPQAQYALGVLHQRGLGVRKDLPSAVSWYERAARQGHVGATYNAGEAYALGIGVKRNFGRARLFFLRAAEAADAESQHRLGEFYEKGLGVERDKVVAFKWYTLAGQQGYRKGGDAAARLVHDMTKDQRDQASELILEHKRRFDKK